jgi:hypothetical protein
MGKSRSSTIHRLRQVGGTIFGTDPSYFVSGYDRESVPEFQQLLGITDSNMGKRYPMFPPILYPEDSGLDARQLFLNPAIAKVSKISFITRLADPSNLDNQSHIARAFIPRT